MLLKRVIPCLDVDGGRVVKGTNFVDIRDAGDPVELAMRYEAEGADELCFLDITASSDQRDTVVELARRMSITKERLFATLGLPRATVDRKVRENKALSPDESSRVLGVVRLVGHAQTLVDESGEPQDFNAAQWVANWLAQPMPALAGHCPAELMDTAEGQAIVANLLERAQSGAYA